MANTYDNLDDLFTDIADAIRLKNCSTESIVADTFPDEIRSLNTGFDYVNHNITEIKDYQFRNCTDLKNVFCCNVEKIGKSAFEGCSNLETIVIYNYDGKKTKIDQDAFKGCNDLTIYYTSEIIPDSWNGSWNPDDRPVNLYYRIENWSINDTGTSNAQLYNDYTHNNGYTLIFRSSVYENMRNYEYKNVPWSSYLDSIYHVIIFGVTNIGNHSFRDMHNLKSVYIDDSVTEIGNGAFVSCSRLTNITIPNSVTTIYGGAFRECIALSSITISKNIKFLRDTFIGCVSLTSINYGGTISQWNEIKFYGDWDSNTGNYTIYCTDGTITKDGTITYYNTGGES